MPFLTGGQALVQSLKREGVTTVFGLPGIQLDWAFDALWDERESIQVSHTRHEQATSYMADGYARTTGQAGVCFVVPGPGLLNASAGLATAYACSSPVLCLTGQIQSELIGRGRGVLHEIPDQLATAASLTKWAARAMHPTEIPRLVQEAFRQLRTGRPRPVELEIPPDVLQSSAEVALLDPHPVTASPPDPELLERAARLLGTAERPLIFVGGGVLASGAGEELRLLAEMLQAPVIPSRNGKGSLSDRHYLAQYPLSTAELLSRADVILAVGTRFVQSVEATWPKDANPTVIQLDVDPSEIGRNRQPTIGLVSDAKLGLASLLDRVARHNRRRESRQDELVTLKLAAQARLDGVQPQAAFARAVRESLPDDGIVVVDSTQVGYWSHTAFPVYEPRTYLGSGYQGTLGFGFPTALGAQVGNPGRRVVSINGDGGFLFNIQELSTAAQQGINTVAVVFDDGAFGNVRRIQKETFHGHTIASELRNPDFVKLADAFGIRGALVETPDGLARAIREALRAEEPALVAVPVGEMPSIQSVLRAQQASVR